MIKTMEKIEQPNFQKAWSIVEEGLFIKNEKDYENAVKILDKLLDSVGTNENHPMYSYLDTLGTLIGEYEDEHLPPMGGASPKDVLQSLMDEHGLDQRDLPEVASQGVISELLSGKRDFTLRQIRQLSKRFCISSEVFI